MRTFLASAVGMRLPYTGVFIRYGRQVLVETGQPRPRKKAGLLQSVCNYAGDVVADHLWISPATELVAAGVRDLDGVAFTAIAQPYERGQYGYNPGPPDYKLIAMMDIQIV